MFRREVDKYLRNRHDVKPIQDTCGLIWELYHSDNMSIAYITIRDKALSHKHLKMEEAYYIQKGMGLLYLGEGKLKVIPGDTITIPKGVYHHLENLTFKPLELLVITHPRYDNLDVILEQLKDY